MTATFLVGDVRARMAELDDGTFDLILCSPPFLALRSYLPDGHPDKHLEIGSEATPAEFLDVMLELTAEWGRLLAPHGSIAIELGDTYAGSGGGGGDYTAEGLRAGQNVFDGSGRRVRETRREGYIANGVQPPARRDLSDGWPLAKSLVCVPQLYQIALAYGRNPLRSPLTARELLDVCEQWAADDPDLTVSGLLAMMREWIDHYTEIGPYREYERWRIRNLKAWIRSNPPVGALGDKERPATSYIIVACRATDRWFDLDAVRTSHIREGIRRPGSKNLRNVNPSVGWQNNDDEMEQNAGGAPPRDWVHTVDLILDTELANRAGKTAGWSSGDKRTGKNDADRRGGNWSTFTPDDSHEARHSSVGAQGVHLRRALENAGIPLTPDTYDISPKGYRGAHYAVWPPELARRLIDEMCPRQVCTSCGKPSRRIVEKSDWPDKDRDPLINDGGSGTHRIRDINGYMVARIAHHPTVGWSDCGHNQYRPGRVLDPFVGSGTTLAVATGMARDSVGIDLDARNATLAYQRVGMFLEVDGDMQEPDLTPAPVVDVLDSL